MSRIRKMGKRGWYWTPWTGRFDHGGWVYANWREPIGTFRWWWRFWRGAPGCDTRNPSRERYGPVRYAVKAFRDGYVRALRQTAKDYRLWRMGSGRVESAVRTVPEALYLVRTEAGMFADRMRRGSFWGRS